jgi:hypothetical protein
MVVVAVVALIVSGGCVSWGREEFTNDGIMVSGNVSVCVCYLQKEGG